MTWIYLTLLLLLALVEEFRRWGVGYRIYYGEWRSMENSHLKLILSQSIWFLLEKRFSSNFLLQLLLNVQHLLPQLHHQQLWCSCCILQCLHLFYKFYVVLWILRGIQLGLVVADAEVLRVGVGKVVSYYFWANFGFFVKSTGFSNLWRMLLPRFVMLVLLYLFAHFI